MTPSTYCLDSETKPHCRVDIRIIDCFVICLLTGLLDSSPMLLPGRHVLNAGMAAGTVGAMVPYMMSNDMTLGLSMLGVTSSLSAIMGVTLTSAIGGPILSFIFYFFYIFLLVINF